MEPNVDIALIKGWALQAGEIALSYFNRAEPSRKEDRTLVTRADQEIEIFLTQRLRETYPHHGIIGEEGTREVGGQYLWAIDPIDGTRAFVSGLPVWGVSIGLLKGRRPCLGVFYMPLLRECYHVDSSGEAFWNDRPIHCPAANRWDKDAFLCVPSNSHRRYTIDFPGITRALGSTAAHMSYVARGKAVGALLGHPSIWDIAAALAILERAGGTIRYLSGQPVDLGELRGGRKAREPVVAAHPALISRFLAAIRVKDQQHH